ncbi:tanabin-like [Emydura macquarii macquarii]|uniref:tanabin-like n=1 Tax=Emydura macquarii macquarii TaxID=1129001 RepID=UPI00352B9381
MAFSIYTAKDTYFKELVRMHFETGMHELVSLTQCRLKAEEDPNVYMEVREHIEKASQELAQAEALTQAELNKTDSECEKMVLKKKNLKDEKKEKSESVKALKSQLCTSVRSREEKTAVIEKVNDYIRQTQQWQAIAEERVETQRSRRRAALWSMLIPVVGTVIGGGVAIASQIALKNAKKQVAVIERDIKEHRSNVVKFSEEVEKYSKLVEEHEASIRGTEKRILEIEELESNMMVLHNKILELQELLRHNVYFLGTLNGKANVAEITTKYVYDYENLRRILGDTDQQADGSITEH